MTLREEFENEVKHGKSNLEVLFETNSKNYINWLEVKMRALNQLEVSNRRELLIDLINKAQTPKGNVVIGYLMKEYEKRKIN